MSASDIVQVLQRYRFAQDSEERFQSGIARCLVESGVVFEREHILTKQDRIDFLCGRVGVECKIQGSLASVTRQLHRYAQCPEIDELLLVTTRLQHSRVPKTINGKPITVFASLGGLL